MISRWRSLEDNLDVEIDPRILAYLESQTIRSTTLSEILATMR